MLKTQNCYPDFEHSRFKVQLFCLFFQKNSKFCLHEKPGLRFGWITTQEQKQKYASSKDQKGKAVPFPDQLPNFNKWHKSKGNLLHTIEHTTALNETLAQKSANTHLFSFSETTDSQFNSSVARGSSNRLNEVQLRGAKHE